jgi:hypothetical protein
MFNPDSYSYYDTHRRSFETVAKLLSIELAGAPVHNPAEIEDVAAKLAQRPGSALLVTPDPFLNAHRGTIIRAANQGRVPASYSYRQHVQEGGLTSYGPDSVEIFARSASYVDRILKGTKPSDLPAEGPVKFELAINLKTAKEGFFLEFAPEALAYWLSRAEVLTRARQLQAGATAWIKAKRAKGILVSENSFRERERPEYVMAHTLAHALMSEVALDCGYPASSLKERIYVLPRVSGQPIRCGILIYTASAGNQGTLGGLVEVTRRFVRILNSALERERLCSGDPVCADHDPATAGDDRTLHGAACHGCLLVAETSCEARNVFLDRALIVDTVGQTGAGFF